MFTLNCKGKLLALDEPRVMGVITSRLIHFMKGAGLLGKMRS